MDAQTPSANAWPELTKLSPPHPSVLEPGRTLTLAERGGEGAEVVVGAPGFLALATMNPGGDFGKKELSPALSNRFTQIWVPAITDPGELQAILESRWDSLLAVSQNQRVQVQQQIAPPQRNPLATQFHSHNQPRNPPGWLTRRRAPRSPPASLTTGSASTPPRRPRRAARSRSATSSAG